MPASHPLYVILASVLFSALGHMAVKLGVPRLALDGGALRIVAQVATNGWLVTGLALHVAALVLWVLALRKVDLSFAAPFISLSFVVIALLSYVVLNEPFGGLRIAGTALVVIGVVLVAQT
jgi:drug/metabolite transporter (DMT)-like permease